VTSWFFNSRKFADLKIQLVLVGEVSNNFQHTKKVKWINFADFVHQMMVDDGFIFFFSICTRSLKKYQLSFKYLFFLCTGF